MEGRVCLIVDDELCIRNYLKAILERQGWRCLEAGNAMEARHVVESLHGELDLLLTDIDMPGEMNGAGLAEWVRDGHPNIPIILISGSADLVPAGFPLVRKPCKPETVLKAVASSWRRAG